MTNFIKLKPGLFYQNYVFFDVEQYYADNLFIQHKIKGYRGDGCFELQ